MTDKGADLSRSAPFGQTFGSLQMQITTRKINIAVSLGVLALALFFYEMTSQIVTGSRSEIGPDTAPRVLCWILIILGGLGLIAAFAQPKKDAEKTVKFKPEPLLWIAGVSAIGLAYYFAFLWFGYLVSTGLCLMTVLYVFGVRGRAKFTALVICGTLAYYFVFIRLMHVYDPPGQIIDFSSILRF